MKHTQLLSMLLGVILLTGLAFAQGPGNPPVGPERPMFGQKAPMSRLGLTDQQQAKIEKLRLQFEKEMLPLRDKVKSLNTEYRLMVIDEKASKAQLKAQLDKISALRTTMALKRAEHQRQIRNLLTDEQKLKYDQHYLNPGRKGMMMGHKKPPRRPSMMRRRSR